MSYRDTIKNDPEKLAAYKAKQKGYQVKHKERVKADPEKLAAQRVKRNEQSARYRAKVKADPEKFAAQKAKQKGYQAKHDEMVKADPERLASKKAKQKECQAKYHERISADPERAAIRKAKKQAYYQANKEVYAQRALEWREKRVGMEFPPVEDAERKCVRCGTVQPMDQFGINRYHKSGRATRCKSCVKAANARTYLRLKAAKAE